MARSIRGHRRVQWKPGETRTAVLRPHPLMPVNELPPGLVDSYMPYFSPGALWTTVFPMREMLHVDGSVRHELPYLVQSGHSVGPTQAFPIATMAVYTGAVRVEELPSRGDVVRVPRHTFLVGGRRYMVLDLTCLKPTDLQQTA